MTVAELIEELKECPQDAPVSSGMVGEPENVVWRTEAGDTLRIVRVVLI